MFEKSLQDLVKGIRAIKGDTGPYVSKAIQEIKDELKSRDVMIKAQALQKLCYLNMCGHDMSWAAFHVIEVMSQERFGLKRIGFSAAAQSFTSATDVIVLCTALLKREFSARSPFEVGLAINCLSNIATEDLSRDLLGDVVTMLTSSRPYIRKKATLLLFKLYLRYPQGLRLTFDNLKRKLTDENPSTVSCAVNVICELARKKPSNYLALAPDLFALLTTSTNNWMLIKVAKLMSALVQEEPRLARKLLEPLANIVQTTPAKSLMYECVSTLTYALQHTKKADGTDAKNAPAVVRLCTDKLREMVRDPDQNLKYLGLTGLMNLMLSNPRVVAEHRELVLQCLVDDDVTIRLRALELITGMVTRRNLPDIVGKLLELLSGNTAAVTIGAPAGAGASVASASNNAAEGHWRDELIAKLLFMCSRDKYAYMTDFGWYVRDVLARLLHMTTSATKHAAAIAGQLLDVAVRVEEVRPVAVQTLLPMLADANLADAARAAAGTVAGGAGSAASIAATGLGASATSSAAASAAAAAAAAAAGETTEGATIVASLAGNGSGAGVNLGAGHALLAAAWIVGEYGASILPPQMHGPVLDALLQPGTATLPAPVQAVYMQCSLKILAAAATAAAAAPSASGSSTFMALAASVLQRLHPYATSVHVEVQERACLSQQLLATLGVPFTPLPTLAKESKADASADSDLLALAGAGAGNPPSTPGNARPSIAALSSSPPKPLEGDIKVIASVLSSLFAEPLRPVNPKAQKKVPVPEGLDLDAWIRPEEEKAAADEERAAAIGASKSRRFVYESISFEDSYGVNDEDEYAANSNAEKSGGKKKGKKGSRNDDEEEDDAWLQDLAKKNSKRDKELWGDDAALAKKMAKDGPALAAVDRLGKGGASGGKSDPFYLKSDNRSRAGTSASFHAGADIDVDSIPIGKLKLGANELGAPRNSLAAMAMDVSIFGDFGKKGKKGGKDEDGKKKKKKKAADSDDEDEDAGKKVGKTYRIAEDDDLPPGQKGGDDDDDDDDSDAGKKKSKGGSKKSKGAACDALADIDLSSPLRDDEVIHTYSHRTAGGAAPAEKKRGRARILGGGEASAAAAPAPAAAEGKKEKKGEKKDKKEKKEKKEGASASKKAVKADGEGEKKKKTKKAAAGAGEAEEEKKVKKSSKKDKESSSSSSSSSAAAAAPVPAPSGPLQGDEYAAAEPFQCTSGQDKVVKVSYNARSAASKGVAASTASPAMVSVEVVVKVDPKSSKKTVDWVDLQLAIEAATATATTAPREDEIAAAAPSVVAGIVLQQEGGASAAAGAASNTVRVATALKEKSKTKPRHQEVKFTLLVPAEAVTSSISIPAKVTYQVTPEAGSSKAPKTVTLEVAPIVLRSSALLVPTQVEAEAYRALMLSEGSLFTHAMASIAALPGSGVNGDGVLNLVCGALRSHAVARSPKHAILYARLPASATAAGSLPEGSSAAHVTALLKQDESGSAVNVTVKSVVPGHATVLVNEIAEAIKAELAILAAAIAAKAEE